MVQEPDAGCWVCLSIWYTCIGQVFKFQHAKIFNGVNTVCLRTLFHFLLFETSVFLKEFSILFILFTNMFVNTVYSLQLYSLESL